MSGDMRFTPLGSEGSSQGKLLSMQFIKRTLNFGAKTKVKNPDIIREEKDLRYGTPVYNSTQIKGDFYRVIPANAREVFYLRNLEHRVDKFAPARGNGVIVRCSAIDAVANHA
jgi:hypothetical protein